jgi:hypothetical protein
MINDQGPRSRGFHMVPMQHYTEAESSKASSMADAVVSKVISGYGNFRVATRTIRTVLLSLIQGSSHLGNRESPKHAVSKDGRRTRS